MTPDVCPNCGADVPSRARSCPECGSDEDTGWSDEAAYDGVGLPDEFDYDQFVEREFGEKGPSPQGVHWFWWAVSVVLLIAIIMYLTL
jgi:hypothetical protein